MRNTAFVAVAIGILSLANVGLARAQCTLPYSIANGQTADATKVMANYNALVNCLAALAPSGSSNSIQYNGGSGAFSGVGPLTNGQLVVGSTGSAPQAKTLTPGAGIAITNGPGSVTISGTGGLVGGLYSQVMSATPTSASTGLTNWLNQGSATVSDSATGLCINAPSSGGSENLIGRYIAAPTVFPYTFTALVAGTRNSSSYNEIGIGWYDGSSKLHVLSYQTNNGGSPFLEVEKWNSPTSYSSHDFASSNNGFSQPIWLQIENDGTNIYFNFSQDGANFLTLFTTPLSAGFLGPTGYNDIVFFIVPQGSQTLGTLMSWKQN